jgi:ethanolamine utilization protein EutN
MKFGKVVGNYISSPTSPNMEQGKLLLVQPLEFDGTPLGEPFIAIDSVGAGAGEYIFWVGGMEATFPFENNLLPVDACIVGIVDKVSLYGLCPECNRLSCPKSVDPNKECKFK